MGRTARTAVNAATDTVKVAIVTGAATGIGRAIAWQLHEDGFAVAINDISAAGAEALATEIQNHAGRALAVPGDVGAPDFAHQMVARVVTGLGGLDVMVANAGVNVVKPLLELSRNDLESLFAVNVFGVLHCIQAAAQVMITQGRGGKIINAASAAGKRGYELLGAYCASKFSVIGLTQTAALELARHGITVNAYCPGAVDTAMWGMIDQQMGILNQVARGETLKARIAKVPLGRVGYPTDVARLVSFLASDKSDYITGQSLVVDGGVILS